MSRSDVPGGPDEASLWTRWRDHGDRAAYQALADRHLWLAKAVAAQILRSRTSHDGLDYRELVQLGTVGLLEAIGRYDPSEGTTFPQFAGKRVRGAIVDGIDRHSEYHAQSALRRTLQRERARSLTEGQAHAPRDKKARFQEMVDTAVGLAIGLMLEDTPMYVDERRPPAQGYQAGELALLREQLKFIVEGLPEQERFVVRYHYFHEMAFTQIADLMQLTKGRISQIHAKAMASIRRQYKEFGELDVLI